MHGESTGTGCGIEREYLELRCSVHRHGTLYLSSSMTPHAIAVQTFPFLVLWRVCASCAPVAHQLRTKCSPNVPCRARVSPLKRSPELIKVWRICRHRRPRMGPRRYGSPSPPYLPVSSWPVSLWILRYARVLLTKKVCILGRREKKKPHMRPHAGNGNNTSDAGRL